MPPITSANASYEILDATGTIQIPLMLVRPEQQNQDDPAYPTIQQALQAAEAGRATSDGLEVTEYESWHGGIGAEEYGYNVAIGVETRTPNAAFSAGAMTQVQAVNVGVGGPIVAWAEFAGFLFYAQEGTTTIGGRVCKSSDGTGVGAGAFANADAMFPLAAGQYVRDLFVHDDGSAAGTMYLHAMVSDVNGLNGRILRTSDGVTWGASGAIFGTNGRGRTKRVSWRSGGISAQRIVTISGPNKISYTLPDGDSTVPGDWVEGIKLMTPWSLIDLAAAKTHVWASTRDNLLDFNEDGDTIELMADAAFMPHGANGLAVYYQDGWVYQTAGDGGLHRVWVGDGTVLQEQAGTCGPGYNTAARSDWLGGYATAILGVQGYICVALYNPLTERTGIFFGIDREKVRVKTRNPLAWYGPNYTLNANYKVTRMWTSTLAGDRRLWIGADAVDTIGTTSHRAVVLWGSLSDAGAPLDTILSDGLHRYTSEVGSGFFQPYSRLELLPDAGNGVANGKVQNDVTISSEGLGDGTKLTVYQRSDPAPRSTAWGTGTDITTSPSGTFVPATEVAGRRIQTRIDFVNPDGNVAYPTAPDIGILTGARTTRWEHVPSTDTAVLTFEYGDGVTLVNGGRWSRLNVHPDTVTAQLEALMTSGRTTIRDPYDNRKVAKLHQILDRVETITERGDYKKHVRIRIKMSILEDAA